MFATAHRTITDPVPEQIITLADAKAHLRVTHDDEDAYIASLITLAERTIEHWTNRKLAVQTLQSFYGGFSSMFILPYAPVTSITHIKYYAATGTSYTLPAADYQADLITEPHFIVPAYQVSWPSIVLRSIQPVEIQYVAGYSTPAAVPQPIKQAMLLMIGHWFLNRENVSASERIVARPLLFGAERLVDQYVVRMTVGT